jgi:hypothetical protein
MTFGGAKRLLTTFAVVLSFPGGASTALADDDMVASPDRAKQSQGAARHERLVEAWLAEQRHAARPTPRPRRSA